MGQTALQQLPYPEATEQPFVHLDIKELADSVDPLLFVSCLSTLRPAHKIGRRIFETDTKLTYISDGTAWRLLAAQNGGITIGVLNTFGQVAIGHGLGYTPTMASLTMIGPLGVGATYPGSPAVDENTPRDYGVTLYGRGPADLIIRVTNLRTTTWAGSGLVVGVIWTAR